MPDNHSEFDPVYRPTTQTGPLAMLVPPKESTTANKAAQPERNRAKKFQKQEGYPFGSNIRSYLFYL